MKRNMLFLMILISFSVLLVTVGWNSGITESKPKLHWISANQNEWSEPVNVSRSGGPSYLSKVAADASGKAYVMWVQEPKPKRMYFNTNESGEWGTPENITGQSTRIREGPWPELNVDIDGNACAVYTGHTDGNYEIVYRRRKGKSWSPRENASKTQAAGSVCSTLLVDKRTNDYFIIWQDDIDRPHDEATYWIGYVRYKNNGEGSWVGAGAINSPGARAYSWHAAMDFNGTAYTVWMNRAGGGPRIDFSENRDPKINSGWTAPLNISDGPGEEPQVACDDSGNVYVVWMARRNDKYNIFFTQRINGDWQAVENLSDSGNLSELPTIAVNARTGTVHVAWQERTPESWEVFYRKNEGGEWRPVENLSNNPSTSSQPNLFVDDIGGIHLSYTDNKSGGWNIFYQNIPGAYEVYPPVHPQLSTTLDSFDNPNPTKTNYLTWADNPNNEGIEIKQYNIYRKRSDQPNTSFEILTSVSGDTYQFDDRNLPTNEKYNYYLTSVSPWDKESEKRSPIVDEQALFPVFSISVKSAENSFLFYKEKINTLFWSHNPLNDAITVASYNIYRRNSESDELEYELIFNYQNIPGEVEYVYTDRYLPLDEDYIYMITVLDDKGNESEGTDSTVGVHSLSTTK